MHGGVGLYFEAAAVIVTLVLLGQVLELRAREQTGSAIRALLDLAPKTAHLVEDGGERTVPLERVQPGDTSGSSRARRCRWTASSSKASPRSTNRC